MDRLAGEALASLCAFLDAISYLAPAIEPALARGPLRIGGHEIAASGGSFTFDGRSAFSVSSGAVSVHDARACVAMLFCLCDNEREVLAAIRAANRAAGSKPCAG